MKKMLLALVMVVLFSGTAWAVEGRVTPAIPFDYNGNPAPVIRDSGNGWLLDSGVVTIADTVAVHIDDTTVTVNSGDSALLVVLDDTDITVNSGDSALLVILDDTSVTVNSGDSSLLVSGTIAVDSVAQIVTVDISDTTVTVNSGDSALLVVLDDTDITVNSGDSALLVILDDTSVTINSGDSAVLISGRLDSITDTVTVATAPYNGNAGGTAVFSESVVVPVAIDLGSEYYLWVITSDTDCVISPDSATLTPLNGDIVRQYDPFIYPGRLQTVYAVTRTGLIDSAAVIRARGWR